MNFAFTPRSIEGMRPRIQEITDERLDSIEGRGEADLMSEFAAPLPIAVVAELLGVPPELRGGFRGWADALLGDDPEAVRPETIFTRKSVDRKGSMNWSA